MENCSGFSIKHIQIKSVNGKTLIVGKLRKLVLLAFVGAVKGVVASGIFRVRGRWVELERRNTRSKTLLESVYIPIRRIALNWWVETKLTKSVSVIGYASAINQN